MTPAGDSKVNERILELARQVWPDPSVSHVNHEKFAELIVRECAEICLEANDHKNILQHFGVEE